MMALTLLTPMGPFLSAPSLATQRCSRQCRCTWAALVNLIITLQCVPQFYLHEISLPSILKEVLDNLDSHLKKSEYFHFLWFSHSENISIIYWDHTKKPPFSSANWFWDYAIRFYLLKFLLWISSFCWAFVSRINRFFF